MKGPVDARKATGENHFRKMIHAENEWENFIENTGV